MGLRRLSIIGPLMAALVTAGCGSSNSDRQSAPAPSPGDGVSAVSAAYAKTIAAKTARVSFSVTLTGTAAGSSANTSVSGSGVQDYANKRSRFTMTLPTVGSVEVRQIGPVAYAKLPGAVGARSGKPWIKVDVSKLSTSGLSDPTQSMSLLNRAAGKVTKVGTESVRGVATTHYSFDLDLTKAVGTSGASTALAEKYRRQLGRDTLPVDLWADKQNRIARLRMSIPPPKLSGSSPSATTSGQGATVTIELYDYGTAVDVSAPPPDQVRVMQAPDAATPAATA